MKNFNEQWPKAWPEECKCFDIGWEHVEVVPPVCDSFVGEFSHCERCNHDFECHIAKLD